MHTPAAIMVLVGIMNDKQAFDTARVSAAKELLDRAHGKPRQSVDLNATFDLAEHLANLTPDE